MVQLRKPCISGVQVDSRDRSDKHQSPNHVTEPCDGCNTWGWCGRHRCCWRLEQADIRAERVRGVRGVQTGDDPRGGNRIR